MNEKSFLTEEERQDLLNPKALPFSAHRKNPRNVMDYKIWREISSLARERVGLICELCLNKFNKKNLHAHEIYKIDNKNFIISFYKVVSLCRMCHRIQHMGLAGIHLDRGKFKEEAFNNHLKENLKVNKTFDDMYKEFQEFFIQVEPKYMEGIGCNLLYNPFYTIKINDFKEPLFSIWKEKDPKSFFEMAKGISKYDKR